MAKFTALNGFPIVSSGNSAPFGLEGARDIAVMVSVAAGTGTNTKLDLWMCGSSDNGVTWYDVAGKVLPSTVAAGGRSVVEQRNIVSAKYDLLAEKFRADFSNLADDYIAFFWVVSGSSPSFPVTITVVPK